MANHHHLVHRLVRGAAAPPRWSTTGQPWVNDWQRALQGVQFTVFKFCQIFFFHFFCGWMWSDAAVCGRMRPRPTLFISLPKTCAITAGGRYACFRPAPDGALRVRQSSL
jgi:hypothetical protein